MVGKKIISSNPNVLSGASVFKGTRVPVQTFWDYLDEGRSTDEFLDDFPTVSKKQVHQLISVFRQETNKENYERLQSFAG